MKDHFQMMNTESPNSSNLIAQLRAARKDAGLSQEQAGKLMNLNRVTISQIENGRRQVTAGELVKFAELYDTNPSLLLGGDCYFAILDGPRLQFIAHQLSKLGTDDLNCLFEIIVALKSNKGRENSSWRISTETKENIPRDQPSGN